MPAVADVSLPDPACPRGYSDAQIREIFGDRLTREGDMPLIDRFRKWMYGQTTGVCDGTRFNETTDSATSFAGTEAGVIAQITESLASHAGERFEAEYDGRELRLG